MELKPTFLIILDGFGLAPAGPGNAVSKANIPTLNKLLDNPGRTQLECSGRAVGLPPGFMGNSEVGHMNIGAGRVVNQDMTRIDIAIEENTLGHNHVIAELLENTSKSGGTLHFMGLLSDGGVHSHIRHLFALLELAKKAGVPAVVHAFMDGRDTSPTSGKGFVAALLQKMRELGHGKLAGFTGRYYAMDRDKRWDRTKVAWDSLVHGNAEMVEDAEKTIEQAYAAGETDEFMKPRLLAQADGALCNIKDGDSVFFFNFRADRARQLTEAFFADKFDSFDRVTCPKLAGFITMTPYESSILFPAAFDQEEFKNVMGEVVSNLGATQLRIAETEKYAHVTYFFNGGREEPFTGEDRQLIPSPRDVATYDLKPQMSAVQVKDTFIREWSKHRYNFVVCNFANPDMVGHSGIMSATIKALEIVDGCVAELLDFADKNDCRVFITADHGNSEALLTEDGKPMTAHTTNPVPFIMLDKGRECKLLPGGKLGDISPTILAAWGVEQPKEMTGKSLLG